MDGKPAKTSEKASMWCRFMETHGKRKKNETKCKQRKKERIYIYIAEVNRDHHSNKNTTAKNNSPRQL